jgi:3-dehydroquinate dehydratase-2
MKKILVIHGPNLNMLGLREPHLYGHKSLKEIDLELINKAQVHGIDLETFQSNSESQLIDKIQAAYHQKTEGIILNPAAFTHTSIALRDTLLAVNIPFIEVHLSNIFAREPFRQHSFFSDIAQGVISGLGPQGYLMALNTLIDMNI